MKKSIFGRLTTIVFCTVLVTLALADYANAQRDTSGNVKTTIAQVHVIATGAVVPQAGASLARNNSGVFGENFYIGSHPG